MDKAVKKAVLAGIEQYAKVDKIDAQKEITTRLLDVFQLEASYLDKLEALDGVFDDFPLYDELREVYVDLLLMNFLSSDVQRFEEDYLDSEEWEAIEDETLDRGTELLNVLIYLRECKDESIEPELEDYLKEFLLVDEDEFQDEHEIYQDVIANQMLMESTYQEISKVAKKIDPESELFELFYGLMSFFNEINPTEEQFVDFEVNAENPAFDSALYKLLTTYSLG